MKKLLVMILLVVGSFSFGDDMTNRWIRVRNSNNSLFTKEKTGYEVEEMITFIQENKRKSDIIVVICEVDIYGETIVLGFNRNYKVTGTEGNCPVICQVDNKKKIVLKGSPSRYTLGIHENTDKNVKNIIAQMKNGNKIKITLKLNGKNETFVVPLKGLRALYK